MQKSDLIEIGVAWLSKSGNAWTGKFGNARLVILPNKNKTADNQPDMKVFVAPQSDGFDASKEPKSQPPAELDDGIPF